jgi:two-component system cell cycle sensor histidine kinase/response regulator CckA
MNRPPRALSIRALLIIMVVVAVLFGLVLTLEIAAVIRPAAGGLHNSASEQLAEHDQIRNRMADMRSSMADLERVFQRFHTDDSGLAPGLARGLVAPVRARLDSVVAMQASLQLSQIPPEMRFRLADAVESETDAGLTMLDAIHAMEMARIEVAAAAIRRAEVQLDATATHLAAAQAVAVRDLLSREAWILGETRTLVRFAIGWAALGAALFLVGVWLVRVRLDRPLHELETAVTRVAGGDLSADARVLRPDELGRLATHFNAMTAVLRERALDEARQRDNLTERFGRILDESSNEIYLFDAVTLRFVQANRGARRHLGYCMAELVALTPLDVLREISPESFAAALGILRRGEQPSLRLSAAHARRDGATYPVEITLQLSSAGESPVFVAVVEDVSARSRMRELNERLRQFALYEHRVISGGDLDAALQAITEMATEALGVSRTSVWSYSPEQLVCLDAFAQADARHSRGQELRAQEQRVYFAALAEGEAIAAHDARLDPRIRGLATSDRLALRAQLDTPVRASGRLVAVVTQEHEGEPRRWSAEEQAFAGSVADLVALAMEAAERHRLQNQLASSQKMESVGRLAGGVAHDFNNLLTAILGYAEFAKSSVSVNDPIFAELAEVEKAALRAADLTRQLLTFARRQAVQPVVLDLNSLAQGADKLLRRLIGEDIELVTLLDPDLQTVRIDPGQLEQVIVNLAINARDAMPAGGRLTIETRNVTLGADRGDELAGSAPGAYVELAVSDTGTGMDLATRNRIFEPFFTTKEAGRGTGLGLSTCYGIVHQAAGCITVRSTPGQGTRMSVYLPAVDESPAEFATPDAHPAAPRGRETILLVEDESQIRNLASRALRTQGYTVLAAINGEDALRLVRESLARIDVVVTDVMLPLMGGPELVARLHRERPALPVIYISGYTGGQLPEQELAKGGTADFMPKPFTPRQLAQRVREVLDRPARLL